MKKLLVTLLAAAMCLSMLAGCGSSDKKEESKPTNESSKAEESKAEESKEESEPAGNVELREFTILGDHASTYWQAGDLEEFESIKALKAMMAANGVDLKFELVEDDQYTSTLQTRFGAMVDVPMYVAAYGLAESEVMELARLGTILDINPMLEAGNGTAKEFFTTNDFGSKAYNKVCTPDGDMYWLPNLYITKYGDTIGQTGTNIAVVIRTDWLKNANMEEPKTLDEFKAALKAFNEADPSGSGANVPGMHVYSYRLSTWADAIAQWFGLTRGIVGTNWDTEKAVSPWHQETVKDYFTYIQDLNEAGLLDAEMVGSNSTLSQKIANNQVGASTTYVLATTWEPTIESVFDPANTENPVCYSTIYPIEAVKGVTPLLALEDPVYIWDEFVFTKNLPDNELGAAFLDVYYSQEHIDLINYGVEGINYEMVNGERVFKQYTASEDGKSFDADQLNQYLQDKADQRLSYGKILYSRTITSDMNFYELDKAAQGCLTLGWASPKYYDQDGTYNYNHWTSIDPSGVLATSTPEAAEEVANMRNDINTRSEEFISAIALGQRSVDEVDAMVAELDELGLTRWEEIYQGQYDRFLGK